MIYLCTRGLHLPVIVEDLASLYRFFLSSWAGNEKLFLFIISWYTYVGEVCSTFAGYSWGPSLSIQVEPSWSRHSKSLPFITSWYTHVRKVFSIFASYSWGPCLSISIYPLEQGMQNYSRFSYHDILMYERSVLHLPVIVENLASLYRFFLSSWAGNENFSCLSYHDIHM